MRGRRPEPAAAGLRALRHHTREPAQ
jgi:hypothetical protein